MTWATVSSSTVVAPRRPLTVGAACHGGSLYRHRSDAQSRPGPARASSAGRRATGAGRGGQGPDLGRLQGAPLPGRQARVAHRPDAGAHEAPHRMADGLAHAADLAVAPLVDDDAQHARAPARPPRAGAVSPSSSSTPWRSARRAPGAGVPPSTSARYSLATPWDGWVSSWASAPSLVRMSRPSVSGRAGRPGRPGARPAPASITVGRPCGSSAVVTTPSGLFKQVVDEVGRHRHEGAVDLDPSTVDGSIRRPSAATSPSTVTRPSAISSSQARREPIPTRARTFWRRSPVRRRRQAASTPRPSADWQVALELAGHLGPGQEVLDRRQLLERVEPEALQEEVGGAEEGRLAGPVGAADRPRCSPAARAGGPRRRR